MATDQAAAADARTRRIEAIAQLEAEIGADWHERFAPGTFGLHELLDRVSLIVGLIDQQILEHPACLQDERWYLLADAAADALNRLYQELGAIHLSADSDATQ
jgi:hypothetical protein